jgi:hypothetical protein
MFERPKTVLALDRSAIETGFSFLIYINNFIIAEVAIYMPGLSVRAPADVSVYMWTGHDVIYVPFLAT